LQRRLNLRTFKLLFGVFGGIIDAWQYLTKNDVRLVFSTGGYVSVPVCLVAWLKKIPVIIHEQTRRVGLSNRISAIFAKKILIGFAASKKFFPKKKTYFVGNTLRDIFLRPWEDKYIPSELEDKIISFKKNKDKYPVILISGGGQGSHLINNNVALALRNLLGNYHVILITGDNQVHRDYYKMRNNIKKLSSAKQKRFIITKFADSELGAYFDLADLFVGRSGALSVYEVGATRTPAIFIPLPWVTHNEQYHNAKALVDLGLAEILSQGILNPEILVQKIDKMIDKIKSGNLDIDKQKLKKAFVTNGAQNTYKQLKKFL
jgi:UDP-N-acetylglucosamine--N-acetylmuramyl-(pentapeptide) pyrophosphoryl-undecaprenol N-acetylglucosamine transferase